MMYGSPLLVAAHRNIFTAERRRRATRARLALAFFAALVVAFFLGVKMERIKQALVATQEEITRARGLVPDGAGLDALNRAEVAIGQTIDAGWSLERALVESEKVAAEKIERAAADLAAAVEAVAGLVEKVERKNAALILAAAALDSVAYLAKEGDTDGVKQTIANALSV